MNRYTWDINLIRVSWCFLQIPRILKVFVQLTRIMAWKCALGFLGDLCVPASFESFAINWESVIDNAAAVYFSSSLKHCVIGYFNIVGFWEQTITDCFFFHHRYSSSFFLLFPSRYLFHCEQDFTCVHNYFSFPYLLLAGQPLLAPAPRLSFVTGKLRVDPISPPCNLVVLNILGIRVEEIYSGSEP